MSVEIITSFERQSNASDTSMSGAKIYVYDMGTTTLRNVYSTSDLSGSPAANPIICDSAGRHDMRYTATGSYKIVVKTSADVTIYTRDNIDGRVPVGSGALAIANGGTGATTAAAALSNMGAADAAQLALVAADVAALSGAQASSEKTHIATGTTGQRPGSPIEGDIRRNTTIPQWEGYNGAGWDKFNTATATTAEIAATIGLSFLSTGTASNSAVIDFTTNLSDTFEEYVIKFSSIKPATDDVSLQVRIGTGGAPTYQTSGYRYSFFGATDSADLATVRSAAANFIALNNSGAAAGIGNAAGRHARGEIRFTNPEGGDFCIIEWSMSYINAGGIIVRLCGAGMWATAGAITGIRFLLSSGNITSGTFRMYGIRKS